MAASCADAPSVSALVIFAAFTGLRWNDHPIDKGFRCGAGGENRTRIASLEDETVRLWLDIPRPQAVKLRG